MKKWFKIVKVFDGKKENFIAYDEKVFGKEDTLQVIQHTREQWINLLTSEDDRVEAVRRKHQIRRKNIDQLVL